MYFWKKLKMINVGVIGIGHLGSIHLKLLLDMVSNIKKLISQNLISNTLPIYQLTK